VVLDRLFYKDSILKRLKRDIGLPRLKKLFEAAENHPELVGYACDWVSENFVGYSIGHVAGRFRKDQLKESWQVPVFDTESFERYLIDETTAVVRFIFPSAGRSLKGTFDPQYDGSEVSINDSTADRIRLVFFKIFLKPMIESVEGEAEIWLLESGTRNQLFRWRPVDREPPANTAQKH
jgi:hypothetical protein